MNYDDFFKNSLKTLKNEGNYRVFADLEKISANFPRALNYQDDEVKEVIVWCSNDYLGMSKNPIIINSMIDAIRKVGAGSGGTRNISGTNHYHVLLERELCYLHQKESALLFNSGYLANLTTLSTIGKKLPDCVFFSDENNHASMIQGMKSSDSKKVIFKHNDLNDLEKKILINQKHKSKVIAFESIYSMDGDFAPISKISKIAKKYNCLTYLDEVHAVGIYGRRGAGLAEKEGVVRDIDIIQGTLAKAFGVIGGYITGNKNLIDFVRSFASGFIFTTSIPPCIASGAYSAIRHLKFSNDERKKLFNVVNETKFFLNKFKIPFLDYNSHIIPVIIGDPKLCREASNILLHEYNIYVQPINYPTVPSGTERLRITASPFHTREMISDLANALKNVFASLDIKTAA